MAEDFDVVRSALRHSSAALLARANVVATGIGYKVAAGSTTGTLSIVCSVTRKEPMADLAGADRIPASVDGAVVDVVETGVLRAFQAPTERHRPAPGGVSIGHVDITAGTLGCLVKRGNDVFILSNNHVLANSNAAAVGDPILQPGPHDGGTLAGDHIADLADFVPISITGIPSECNIANGIASVLNGVASVLGRATRLQAISTQAEDNLVDAAIARPLDPADVSNEILNVGTIAGSAEATLGLAIKKMGRTTGFTTGEVTQVDVTANVQYGTGRIATFVDQFMAGAMSAGGDSGSAVLDDSNRLVGLLFAGSETTTIMNRIQNVFSALNVTL
jgi:hypothetical protein